MDGHGGNITGIAATLSCSPTELIDFSANINPLGPPSGLVPLINRQLGLLEHYPDPHCTALVQAISDFTDQPPASIVCGNGTSELLFLLLKCVDVRRAIVPVPAYIDYERACVSAAIAVHPLPLSEKQSFALDLGILETQLAPGDMVILGQPNNPTGQPVKREALLQLIRHHPDIHFLVDEAFAPFLPAYQSLAGSAANVSVLCSLTKIFAIAGLRLGYLVAGEKIAVKVRCALPPWNVNSLAQAVGCHCLGDRTYREETVRLVGQLRQELAADLAEVPDLRVFPSAANFLLIRNDHPTVTTDHLARELLYRHRIMIRQCDNYANLDQRYFRVAVRSAAENRQLVAALRAIFTPDSSPARQRAGSGKQARAPKKTPALMLLGTGSDVGKSVLVAALARIFLEDGLRVAPFKAQNMSLNSHVTRDGREMGRAQVVQAQACRIDPDVRMNPVLLKPSSDVGSQVIVHGRPVGNMRVAEYVRYKKELWQSVCQAYDSLASEYDLIILEGAGSGGEINLKAHDIVNARMARHAGAPMLLVGDIDRGGVYASFLGHFQVMELWERELLAGFVVNRFRGDASLLEPAHRYLLEATGKRVFGVVPWIDDLALPQEDSVSFKAGLFQKKRPAIPHVEVAVVDFPHISNFTDLEPLLGEPDLFLRIVNRSDEMGQPDAIILPGSKNVPADLAFLRTSGLDRAILAAARQGCCVVGICGGFQMMGRIISDPHGIEADSGSRFQGLGLMEVETVLAREKTLTRKTGVHRESGCPVFGYEIHHGRSCPSRTPVFRFDDGTVCGSMRSDRIWGAYLHGVFDSDPFRHWWINDLRARKGLPDFSGKRSRYDLEPAFTRLARTVRQSLDMDRICRLIGL